MFAKRLSVVLIALMAVPAIAAQKKAIHTDWPSANQVEKAAERVKYQTEHSARAKYRGHDITFAPCDISDIPDGTREKGMILGKLTIEGTSPDKLPAGTYQVFVRKHNDQWQAFFCEKGTPVAKSTECKGDMGDDHKPSFEVNNTTIRYWRLRIAY